jgi:hypothetical protein
VQVALISEEPESYVGRCLFYASRQIAQNSLYDKKKETEIKRTNKTRCKPSIFILSINKAD